MPMTRYSSESRERSFGRGRARTLAQLRLTRAPPVLRGTEPVSTSFGPYAPFRLGYPELGMSFRGQPERRHTNSGEGKTYFTTRCILVLPFLGEAALGQGSDTGNIVRDF